ncbi:hypothetical protein TNCV_956751 [Trichonephila clavipes]|nr:hypothetical protein TNCV_956751 [Trichonephila clavipes]
MVRTTWYCRRRWLSSPGYGTRISIIKHDAVNEIDVVNKDIALNIRSLSQRAGTIRSTAGSALIPGRLAPQRCLRFLDNEKCSRICLEPNSLSNVGITPRIRRTHVACASTIDDSDDRSS